jgi:hypothetical protein
MDYNFLISLKFVSHHITRSGFFKGIRDITMRRQYIEQHCETVAEQQGQKLLHSAGKFNDGRSLLKKTDTALKNNYIIKIIVYNE